MSDNTTLARRSAQALGWSWAGALARALLQFLLQILLARLLGPEAFGQAAAVLLVVGLGGLLAEAGLSSALIQRKSLETGDPGRALAGVLVASLVVAAVIVLLAAPIAGLLGDAHLQTMVCAAAAIVPVHAVACLPPALLQRRFEVKRLQLIQLIAYLIGYGVLGLAMAAGGAGAWSLLAAFATHAALVGLLSIGGAASAPGVAWRPRWAGGAALRGYGARITAANLVNWGLESIDRLMVSRALGPAALGPYAVAAALARAPVTLLVSSAQPVAFAASARLQSENQRLARGYLAVLQLALLVAVPLFVLLAWFAAPVVGALYGASWAAAAAPFGWLCLGVPFFVMLALTGPMLRGVDAVGSEMWAQLAVLVLLGLALALAAGQPLWVVAALVSLATALRALVLAVALARRIELPWTTPWRAWRGGLVIGSQVMLIAALVRSVLAHEGLALLVTLPLVLGLAIASLRWRGAALLGDELVLALSNRRGDSRFAAGLCRWAGLP